MNSIIQQLRSKETTSSPIHIAKHLESIADYHGSDNEPLGELLTKHLFFITVRFDTKRVIADREALRTSLADFKGTSWGRLLCSGLSDRMPTQLSEFGKLHFHISKYLLGSRLNKKQHQQPIAYAFTDFEGSRTGKSDAANSVMPHIHALMLVRPQELDRFQWLIKNSAILVVRVPSIRQFNIEPFSSVRGSLENLISYCMKGINQAPNHYSGKEDLWGVFPA